MQAEGPEVETTVRAPMGALRILSRRDGAEIMLLSGNERPLENGERLHHVSWWPDLATAQAVAAWCAAMLEDAHAPAGPDGWHVFAAEHVPILLRTAKSHVNADIVPKETQRDARPWDRQRIARLGLLVGLGWTAKRIADDPLIRSTPAAVYRQAHRCGLSLAEDGPKGQVCTRLPLATIATMDKAAAADGITRDAIARHWLIDKAATVMGLWAAPAPTGRTAA